MTASVTAAANDFPALLPARAELAVGQRVYAIPRRASAIVTRLFGGLAEVTEPGGDRFCVSIQALKGSPHVWRILAACAPAAEVEALNAMVQARVDAGRAAVAERQARLKADCEALRAKHPELVVGHDRATAAKNARALLRAAFGVKHRGVRFGVKQDTGSMVYSLTVSWQGGPTVDEVRAVVARFQSSRFNGMTDSYDSTASAWTETFGGCNAITYMRDGVGSL